MSDGLTTERPKAKRRPLRKVDAAMRQRIEVAIDRMIEALDALDAPMEDAEPEDEGGDDDLEGDGDPDDEPSLGASDSVDQVGAWSAKNNTCDEREDENEHCDSNGYGTADDEPSLGSLDRRMNQLRWGNVDVRSWHDGQDYEDDGLIEGEGSGCDHECGEDVFERGEDELPCDQQRSAGDAAGITWPPIPNANDAFGGVA
jgi:hypothetical protein